MFIFLRKTIISMANHPGHMLVKYLSAHGSDTKSIFWRVAYIKCQFFSVLPHCMVIFCRVALGGGRELDTGQLGRFPPWQTLCLTCGHICCHELRHTNKLFAKVQLAAKICWCVAACCNKICWSITAHGNRFVGTSQFAAKICQHLAACPDNFASNN